MVPAAEVIAATKIWLERAVIGLNLCPFAKGVHVKRQIHYAVATADTEVQLLESLALELQRLQDSDPALVETTLLIHPWVLADFYDFNAFLARGDQLLERMDLVGVLQIAPFHPHFEFGDCASDDVANCTNRSPFPLLHLLRESSIDRAVAAYPDAATIFERNIETLHRLGHAGWERLWQTGEPTS